MKVTAKQVTVEEFINTVLLHDLALMISFPSLRYLSFGLVADGIEFLGACTDKYHFQEKGRSERRFRRGIERFLKGIDARYSQYNSPSSPYYLYKNLRRAMVHMVWPQSWLALTTRDEATKVGHAHLEIDPHAGKLVLVAEDFYADFTLACEALKARLPILALSNPKLNNR
jgi:hypothetical protein